MISKKAIINNDTGLHARPASKLVQCCSQFTSEIKIIYKEKEVNAKSVINVISSGIQGKSEIVIKAEGKDEKKAAEAVHALLTGDMGE